MALTPGVLHPRELRAVAEKFGVADEQVRRDHLISHVLAAIESVEGVVFYGGTALTRTVLPDLRLSEDIDLIARQSRSTVAAQLVDAIGQGLARSFGEVRWQPPFEQTRDAQPATLEVLGRLSVRVQLVAQTGRAVLPTARRVIEQRYSDAPSVRLQTLTDSGFAAAKISAWLDRTVPRDLFDLHAMAEGGLLTTEAVDLVRSQTNWMRFPEAVVWPKPPSDEQWRMQLGHQTRLVISPETAHRLVVTTLKKLG